MNVEYIDIYGKHSVLSFLENAYRFRYRRIEINCDESKKDDILATYGDYFSYLKNVSISFLPHNVFRKRYPDYIRDILIRVYGLELFLSDEEFSNIVNKDRVFLVLLDHIKDPQNLGAIIRTSVAFGVDALILPKKRIAPLNSLAVKASSGGVFLLPIYRVSNIRYQLLELKELGFMIFGASFPGDIRIWDIPAFHRGALVLGEEGKGLRDIIKKECDFLVEIPIDKRINSLNVSVSYGIFAYEFSRKIKT